MTELPTLPLIGVQINESKAGYNIVTQKRDLSIIEVLDTVSISDLVTNKYDIMDQKVRSAQRRILVRNFMERLKILQDSV